MAKTKKYELQKKEIKRLEGIIEQQKRWGREKNIKTAESKQKMIDRIAESMETPEEAEKAIRFSFNVKEGGANEVVLFFHDGRNRPNQNRQICIIHCSPKGKICV